MTFLCISRLFKHIQNQGCVISLTTKANLSNALPSMDAFHPTHEVIRGDRQCLKKQLFVSVLCLSYLLNLNLIFLFFSLNQ